MGLENSIFTSSAIWPCSRLLRFKLDETPSFKNKTEDSENNILKAFKDYKKEAALMAIGVIFLNVNNYVLNLFTFLFKK